MSIPHTCYLIAASPRSGCPKCGGLMRVIAVIQEPKVIDKILRHLRAQGRDARAGLWATGPPAGGAATDSA